MLAHAAERRRRYGNGVIGSAECLPSLALSVHLGRQLAERGDGRLHLVTPAGGVETEVVAVPVFGREGRTGGEGDAGADRGLVTPAYD